MAYKVLISDPTHADVDSVIEYSAVTLGSPHTARLLIDAYGAALAMIAENPLRFALDDNLSEALKMPIRRCSVKRYGIYYFTDEAARIVYIVGFAHSLQNTPSLLKERLTS